MPRTTAEPRLSGSPCDSATIRKNLGTVNWLHHQHSAHIRSPVAGEEIRRDRFPIEGVRRHRPFANEESVTRDPVSVALDAEKTLRQAFIDVSSASRLMERPDDEDKGQACAVRLVPVAVLELAVERA